MFPDLDSLLDFIVIVLGFDLLDLGAYLVPGYNKSFSLYWLFVGESC